MGFGRKRLKHLSMQVRWHIPADVSSLLMFPAVFTGQHDRSRKLRAIFLRKWKARRVR